ncbi:MAG: fasciclin domain-containing protein, partial [Longimicrobiales bacterium]|nr:fasciclin domain-containing protein [Longimicrobiales bacterium]
MKGTRLIAAVAVAALAACADGPTQPVAVDGTSDQRAGESLQPAESPTIVDIAVSVNEDTGEFSTLIAAVVEADLVAALSATGQRTVFAPTDAAFAALGLNADNIGDELEDDALRDILLYHVANGRRYAEDVVSSDQIRMLNGGFNDIAVEDGEAFIGDAQIIQTDIEATNGVIHVIDAVLLPSTDDGPGDGEDGDDDAGDGAEDDADDDADEEETAAESPTIVDIAVSVNEDTGEFSTLIAALFEAELVDALSAEGQWTVFA